MPNYVHIHEIPNNNFYSKVIGFLISRFSSKIIVVSKSVKIHWLRYISKPLTLIYNGIPKTKIKRIVKTPSKKIKFLTIARLFTLTKDISILLKLQIISKEKISIQNLFSWRYF